MEPLIRGQALIPASASGRALVSSEALSFWGGYDQHTGEIIDRRHPLSGQVAAGRVLAVPSTRGSSTTTAVLLEAVRSGAAPAAILTRERDPFLALAAIVAEVMYAVKLPVVMLSPQDFSGLRDGDWLQIEEDGTIAVTRPAPGPALDDQASSGV
jgi:predicted aconitase with swiveling domain